jgi:hypothetical protein
VFLAAVKELLNNTISNNKEKEFKQSMIEMLCGFNNGSTAAFMKILSTETQVYNALYLFFFSN